MKCSKSSAIIRLLLIKLHCYPTPAAFFSLRGVFIHSFIVAPPHNVSQPAKSHQYPTIVIIKPAKTSTRLNDPLCWVIEPYRRCQPIKTDQSPHSKCRTFQSIQPILRKPPFSYPDQRMPQLDPFFSIQACDSLNICRWRLLNALIAIPVMPDLTDTDACFLCNFGQRHWLQDLSCLVVVIHLQPPQ